MIAALLLGVGAGAGLVAAVELAGIPRPKVRRRSIVRRRPIGRL